MENSQKIKFFLIYFLLAHFAPQVTGLIFPLDVARDVENANWKVKGPYQYVEEGSVLRGKTSNFLPDSFEYGNFDKARGIWVIVPSTMKACPTVGAATATDPAPHVEMPSMESASMESGEWFGNGLAEFLGGTDNETTSTTEATASGKHSTSTSTTTPKSTTTGTSKPLCYGKSNATFTLRHQEMETVTIRYCFGGNATIRVAEFEVSANGQFQDWWIEEKVPLSGRKMVIDALVFDKGDYILIDKITVESLDDPPRPTRPTTVKPTESPEPSPGSGADSLLTPYLFLVVMISYLLFNQV